MIGLELKILYNVKKKNMVYISLNYCVFYYDYNHYPDSTVSVVFMKIILYYIILLVIIHQFSVYLLEPLDLSDVEDKQLEG